MYEGTYQNMDSFHDQSYKDLELGINLDLYPQPLNYLKSCINIFKNYFNPSSPNSEITPLRQVVIQKEDEIKDEPNSNPFEQKSNVKKRNNISKIIINLSKLKNEDGLNLKNLSIEGDSQSDTCSSLTIPLEAIELEGDTDEKKVKKKKKKKNQETLSTAQKVGQVLAYSVILTVSTGSIVAIGYGQSNLLLWQAAGLPSNILAKTVMVYVDDANENSYLYSFINRIKDCVLPIYECTKGCMGYKDTQESALFCSKIIVESGAGLATLGLVAGIDYGLLARWEVTRAIAGAFTLNFAAPFIFRLGKSILKQGLGLKAGDE